MDRSRLDALTPRQKEVIALLGEGLANKQIARALGISESRVKQHVTRLMRMFDVDNRVMLATLVQGMKDLDK